MCWPCLAVLHSWGKEESWSGKAPDLECEDSDAPPQLTCGCCVHCLLCLAQATGRLMLCCSSQLVHSRGHDVQVRAACEDGGV